MQTLSTKKLPNSYTLKICAIAKNIPIKPKRFDYVIYKKNIFFGSINNFVLNIK